MFGGPVCADRISICPLDRVLTYKNLIYLLNLQFCRLPVRPDHRASSTDSRPVGNSVREIEVHKGPAQLYGQTIHVLDRPPI